MRLCLHVSTDDEASTIFNHLHRTNLSKNSKEMKQMTKRIMLVALAFLTSVLFAGNSFAQCTSGMTAHFVGIGSSAQWNTVTEAAIDTINGEIGAGNANFVGPVQHWTDTKGIVVDNRGNTATDTGVKFAVVWDSAATCNVYVVANADSTIGNRCFFARSEATGIGSYGACVPVATSSNWQLTGGSNAMPWLGADVALPATISTWLVAGDQPTAAGQSPQSQCANQGAISDTTTDYCFWNAALTDIRPEDALYATTRALSSYNTTNGLSGLGYNQAACGASGTIPNLQGCVITDSFAKGAAFNVLSFALGGKDPITSATVPPYTTLSTGVAPVVVLASNHDSSDTYGLGTRQSDGSYLFKDINRKVLSFVFDGTTACTADLLPTSPTPAAFGGTIPAASGEGIQAILREPLSGTYNTFEFNGVRTLTGSAATAVGINKISTSTWVTGDDSGQEFDPWGNLPQGPATNFASSHCSAGTGPDGTTPCGDPLYNPSNGSACSGAWRARAIGTGEEVAATLGLDNTATLLVNNGIGYAFWSYQNVAPAATGVPSFNCETGVSGDVTCSTGYLAHYLTVDAVDPLFYSEGGQFTDPVTGASPENPTGPFELPQCGAIVNGVTKNSFPCQQIPFYHIYDGKYPLWSQLRIVTFANNGTGAGAKRVVPEGVINLVAYAQTDAAPGSTFQFSDFVPFLNTVTGVPYQQGTGQVTTSGTTVTFADGDLFNHAWTGTINIAGTNYTIKTVNSATSITTTGTVTTHATPVDYVWNGGILPKGNLNIGVFRSHYLQSKVDPSNGHVGCAGVFTGINITGGSSKGTTCLVDLGGDVGGSVLTVRQDVDFNLDFGVLGTPHPKEIYGLHQ
jgi:hypothetical protein